MNRPIRIANCSGFYGDRLDAAKLMVEGGPIDVLTGDYLAELTMLILWKARQKDESQGYARTFLIQMKQVLGTCLDRGIKVVVNAGGLNPSGLAQALEKLAAELGLSPKIAYVTGDDVLPQLETLQENGESLANLDTGQTLKTAGVQPISANAYLGAWGIVEALEAGADVVICPRVTDASLVVGPAAWWHGWHREDFDQLAGAVAAGHVIECGPQATGGNYANLAEITDRRYPGFPIAEVAGDGSFVITKHEDTGGLVSAGTVTAQLLYEIAGPAYLNPDVTAHFDTLNLSQESLHRVQITGAKGSAPTTKLKVALNYLGGYRNSMTLILTGLDIEEKADWATAEFLELVGGREAFEEIDIRLLRFDKSNAQRNEEATAHLRITVKDSDPHKVGRRFSDAIVALALGGYAGFHATTPPSSESPYGVYWPTLIPADAVEHAVVLPDGTRKVVPHTLAGAQLDGTSALVADTRYWGPTRHEPLGTFVWARSGDKGGNANVGLWVDDDTAYTWLHSTLTVDKLHELLPEADGLEIVRYELPNLRALNFVVIGLLGEGVASSTRPDAQAKGLGEFIRSRYVDIPVSLLP